MPRAGKSPIPSQNLTEIPVEPLGCDHPPEELPREPGLTLKPVEDLVRVLSEAFTEEMEL